MTSQSNRRVALYGSGIFNQTAPSPSYAEQIEQLSSGGYTTLILWSIHVHSNGDFYYNDTLMVQNAQIMIGGDFVEHINALVAGGVKEILLSVGAWGTDGDFNNLQQTWDSAGKANLQALMAAFPVLAVDFDYEPQNGYDQSLILDLTSKIAGLGIGVTYCPYTNMSFWMDCLQQAYTSNDNIQPVLWLNLQCYAGGSQNNPLDWVTAVTEAGAGIADPSAFVVPGYWVAGGSGTTCPEALASIFDGLRNNGITSGFLWNSSDMFQYESDSSASCGGGATFPVNYALAITGLVD